MKKFLFLTIAILGLTSPVVASEGYSEIHDEGAQFEINANEFNFSPNHIVFEKGKRVTITINNIGKMDHEFLSEIFDNMDVDVEADGIVVGGEIEEVEIKTEKSVKLSFEPKKRGTYKFFCEIKNHESMLGTFQVK